MQELNARRSMGRVEGTVADFYRKELLDCGSGQLEDSIDGIPYQDHCFCLNHCRCF